MWFLDLQTSKKIFQKNYPELEMAGNLNFKLMIVFWNNFFWRSKKWIELSEKKQPLAKSLLSQYIYSGITPIKYVCIRLCKVTRLRSLDQNLKVNLQKIFQNEMHNNKLQLKDQKNITTLLYYNIKPSFPLWDTNHYLNSLTLSFNCNFTNWFAELIVLFFSDLSRSLANK